MHLKQDLKKQQQLVSVQVWAWLVITTEGKLAVVSTANQDNPLMGKKKVAGCEVSHF